jgi:hypothetical protein
VATSVLRRGPSTGARAETLVVAVCGLGAVALAGEAVVHVALGCLTVVAGLVHARTREGELPCAARREVGP